MGLSGIAANCQVQGENVQAVTVTAGANASVAYTIACVAPPADAGSIRITTATSGADPDPDGYTFSVDGGAAQPIAVNANTTLPNLAAGAHSVRLAGASGNCSIAGANPRPVAVTSGGTADAAFVISCSATTATTGSIKITTATTGSSLDAGYEVSVDGGSSQGIGSNAELTISNVATGDRSVTIGGLASNCTLQGSNPRTVTVTAGAAAAVAFAVTCTAASTWTTLALPAGFGGSALWAGSRTDIYVAGRYTTSPFDYAVLRYDGQGWTEQLRGDVYRSVWGTSPTDVYVVGGPNVWHFDGNRWQGGPTTTETEPKYLAIWGTSPRDLFAVGSNDASTRGVGWIDHYDGTNWSKMEGHGFFDAAHIYDISGNSPSDVYALGDLPAASDTPPEFDYTEYRVVHYDGNAWTESYKSTVSGPQNPDPGDGYSLTGVWAVAPNDVFLVGSAGSIFRFNGTWSPMQSPTTQNLHDVWGNGSSNVYAVGDGGVLRYDGTRWSVIEATAGIRVWGAGADVFVIKKDGDAILYGAP